VIVRKERFTCRYSKASSKTIPANLEAWLDEQIANLERHILPDYIVHCVNCGGTNVEGGTRSYAYCLSCDSHADSVEFVAGGELPAVLAKIWHDSKDHRADTK
jgi:hypothetical protein